MAQPVTNVYKDDANLVARGEFRASVFVIGEMHADGGTLMVLEASALAEEVTTL